LKSTASALLGVKIAAAPVARKFLADNFTQSNRIEIESGETKERAALGLMQISRLKSMTVVYLSIQ
jgi:hypothetical protein